ncbi:MAG: response regulator [Deltaproteobacteria bacterium]|nr:response regulator [Deltaproteobacteria bacterium]
MTLSPELSQPADAPDSVETPVVLLVDDESRVLDALRRSLMDEPFEILTASSADTALQLLASRHVDVVISDERMPGMSGSEFLTIVCRDYPDTVRIMLTGHASLDAAIRAINEGEIYRLLLKPCGAFELGLALREAVDYRDLRTAAFRLLKVAQHQAAVLAEVEKLAPDLVEKAKSSAKSAESGPLSGPALAARIRMDLVRFGARPSK